MFALKKTSKFCVYEIRELPALGEKEEEEAVVVTAERKTYDLICKSIPYDDARESSRAEREALNASTNGCLTYGEVEYDSLKVIFDKIRGYGGLASDSGVFVDLGSGCGRPVIAAALLHPFRKLVGIEILRGLHSMALVAKKGWLEQQSSRNREVEFLHGSIMELSDYDWTREADVILANSTCFTIPFFAQIEALSERCRPGTYFISLTHALGWSNKEDKWQLLDSIRLKMSWGHAEVNISRRRGN